MDIGGGTCGQLDADMRAVDGRVVELSRASGVNVHSHNLHAFNDLNDTCNSYSCSYLSERALFPIPRTFLPRRWGESMS